MKKLLTISLGLMFFACEKAELPKPLTGNEGNPNTVSVSMGANYENTLYYNLSSRAVIKTIDRAIWDLGFSTDADGSLIVLNGAKVMSVSATNATDLTQITSSSGAVWKYDDPSGVSDSEALKDWELNKVYLLDRGITASGSQIGKIKFKITAHDATSYSVEWAKISATTGFNSATFQKDPTRNFVSFSFTTGAVADVEPPKNDWDLCFGSYTHVFEDGTPYLVNGVISNRNIVRVVKVTEAFDDIDLADAMAYTYSDKINVIGYDWKVYDFGAEIYVIDFTKHYVVKAIDGNYYKLRFLDFYDANGVKGTPSFELVKL